MPCVRIRAEAPEPYAPEDWEPMQPGQVYEVATELEAAYLALNYWCQRVETPDGASSVPQRHGRLPAFHPLVLAAEQEEEDRKAATPDLPDVHDAPPPTAALAAPDSQEG